MHHLRITRAVPRLLLPGGGWSASYANREVNIAGWATQVVTQVKPARVRVVYLRGGSDLRRGGLGLGRMRVAFHFGGA
jgi:hypothetical protein